MRLIIDTFRFLPYYVSWRLAKWVRDVHENKHYRGEISQKLVKAQNAEYEARLRLRSVMGSDR